MFKQFSLRQAYFVCFILLGMWALFAYVTMSSQIEGTQKYAELINISGKQRMLSQRTALLANQHLQGSNNIELLQQLANRMRDDHRYLIDHLPSERIVAIYLYQPYALDQQANGYFERLDKFLVNPSLAQVDPLFQAAEQLLPVLDHAVMAFELESEANASQQMRLEGYILLGTLLTLLLEALFILRPVLRRAEMNRQEIQATVAKQTERSRFYEKIFANANDGIMITGPENEIVDLNPALERISGFSRSELLGELPSLLKSTHLDDDFYAEFWSDLYRNDSWSGEFINRRKDGSVFYQLSQVFVLRDDAGQIASHVAIVRDISEVKEGQSRLEFLALYDILTGLPNRTYLQSQIPKAIERCKRFEQKLATVLFDLDNFKEINDTYGHRVGDLLLEQIGQVLKECIRGSDTVARLGGDEFVLLIEQISGREDVAQILKNVQRSSNREFVIEGHRISVSSSMGASLYPDDSSSQQQLLEHADAAMYHAKKMGKNQFRIFDNEVVADVFSSHLVSQLQNNTNEK